ncbi:hypothetical protein GCM10020295_22750 [Streptomyces cinereospinus]
MCVFQRAGEGGTSRVPHAPGLCRVFLLPHGAGRSLPDASRDAMHELHTAALPVAAFGRAWDSHAGTDHSGQGGRYSVVQRSTRGPHDTDIDILGRVGVAPRPGRRSAERHR